MRYAKAAAVLLVGSAMFMSCQCEQATPPVPTNTGDFAERSAKNNTPTVAKPPAATATHTAAVAAATPTPQTDVKLPDSFPKDVPVFKGATLSQVQDAPADGHNVIFHSTAPVSEVNRFYHDTLTKAGWKQTQTMDRENHAFMTYEQGSTKVNITIADDGNNPGQKIIAIMYYDEPPLPFDEF